VRREDIRFEQVKISGEPVAASARLDYAHSERLDPAEERPRAGAGAADRAAQPLSGVELSVSQDSKQRKGERVHARE
jgi:hypothetical protein